MGGAAPAGLRQRRLKTIFLRAPYGDWAALAQGAKREFRAARLGAVVPLLPTPVVLYAVGDGGHRRWTLMVWHEYRSERLLDLAENRDSLAREGFTDYPEFRSYWKRRNRHGWDPMQEVGVYRLAPLTPDERLEMGRLLFSRLYEDLLVDQ